MSLDLFWLRDESLEDSADLPEPHVLAREIADDLRSALARWRRSWPIWKSAPSRAIDSEVDGLLRGEGRT